MNINDRVVSKQRFFAHLRALAASKKTGTLIVTEPGVERRLYFEDGAVVAATSTLQEESMGYLLAERDIVKAHKVRQAEELLGDKTALLGRKLVELGAMSEGEIGNAVRLKVKETISNILASPEAKITLNDEKFPDVDRVPVSIDIQQLLSAGIEASEKRAVPSDTEETLALEPEPEPEETLALPADQPDDADSQLMQALEGFTETYSQASGPRTAGPVTKPYAVVPPQTTSSPSKSSGTFPGISGSSVGIIAAGVVGVVLLGGGYWFFTRSPEQTASRVTGRVDVPSTTAGSEAPTETTVAPKPESPTPEVSASLNTAAAPRAPARAAPASPPPALPSAPRARQPIQRPAAAPQPQPTPARPAPRQQAPAPPPAQAPPPANLEPPGQPEQAEQPEQVVEPEPPVSPRVVETEPSSPPAESANPAQPTQGAPGDWGSAVFAPKQATVSSAPSNPGVQTGDLVEPSFDVIDPVLIEHPKLKYPNEAKRQKIAEAVVRVRVLVDHTGTVQDVELEKGAGHGFDDVALAAALEARFIPATKDQVQVKMWTVLPLIFRLDD